MSHETIVNGVLGTLGFDAERCQLLLAGTEVAFHCDKFNTRILKTLEDVMGYKEAAELIRTSAEHTSSTFLRSALSAGAHSTAFAALPLAGRLEAIFEVYKALGYGAIKVVSASETAAKLTSATSYLAEGWLENKQRWNLDERLGPACHDVCGHIAAALTLASGRKAGGYRVQETSCRAFEDGKICEFHAEAVR